ncbi:DNA cytosine methyltransferase [Thalassolituus sp.]|uniref:DNA cytosine methyltransferase n=1 Tax=Thalassolituus sp. TaxID=2030822 RepID=UPI00351311CA
MKKQQINIIDLFAGPGGLGEGFSSFTDNDGERPFQIRMSVEKESSAHRTLTLRAMFRKLREQGKTATYFDYVEGRISKDSLIEQHPAEWAEAIRETMGQPTALGDDNERIHKRLHALKKEHKGEPWIVIGGPPCQAYSLVGRARNMGIKGYDAKEDHRHFLYKEYLQVLSIIEPDVFVMENVKGILSSKVDGELIFPRILSDLANPGSVVESRKNGKSYRIFSFVKAPDSEDLVSTGYSNYHDFIIRAEDFGVPQTRHRVILLGISEDILNASSSEQLKQSEPVPIETVLVGLPALRSKLSKQGDSSDAWRDVVDQNFRLVRNELKSNKHYRDVLGAMSASLAGLRSDAPTKATNYDKPAISKEAPKELRNWLTADKPKKVLNHESRGHMNSDLGRYLFSACWALPDVHGETDKPFPKSEDYPECLAPNHANWKTGKFADRFRVQRYGRPATTVTSHISKDGHYFIHPDPTQCRSLTVREAARIQTFPDNYFFEGNRTEQYVQVGNAVPPYLAVQLAKIVADLVKHH